MTPTDKLAAALAYLRERNLYLLDRDNQFRYVPAHETDVRRTIGDEVICLRAPETDAYGL